MADEVPGKGAMGKWGTSSEWDQAFPFLRRKAFRSYARQHQEAKKQARGSRMGVSLQDGILLAV